MRDVADTSFANLTYSAMVLKKRGPALQSLVNMARSLRYRIMAYHGGHALPFPEVLEAPLGAFIFEMQFH
jgi:hypothetical protein